MAVYLDHAASTAVRTEVIELLAQSLQATGNPSSVHAFGRAAKMQSEAAREQVAKALHCDHNEVIFTSGGTESNNLAVFGLFEWRNKKAVRPLVLCLGTEHHAVLEAVEHIEKSGQGEAVMIPVDSLGNPDLSWLHEFLVANAERVALVAAIWANNETGTVIDIKALAAVCKPFGIPVHTDAVAAVGHIDVDFAALGIATLAFTGHKLGAPIGVGGLLVARGVALLPQAFGGSQERGFRAGTVASSLCSALALATELAVADVKQKRTAWEALRERVISGVTASIPGVILVSVPQEAALDSRLSNIVNFAFPGCSGDSLLFLLDRAGIAISNGSACTAGVIGGSHVLLAQGYSTNDSSSSVRLSFGAQTTAADIEAFLAALPEAHSKALAAGFTV